MNRSLPVGPDGARQPPATNRNRFPSARDRAAVIVGVLNNHDRKRSVRLGAAVRSDRLGGRRPRRRPTAPVTLPFPEPTERKRQVPATVGEG